MCITTVVRANKSECIYKGSDFSSWFFNVIDDCIDSNDLLLPTYTFTELDTLNHLHKVEVNSSSIPNMAEIDVSQFDFPNTIWIVKPSWEVALKTSIFLPVIFGGVFFNFLLFTIISKNRVLWTSTNMFIANMALADLITLLIGPWMLLVNDCYQNYVLGAFFCKIQGFIQAALLITVVMNLCAISYDRLTAIVLPMEAKLSRKSTIYIMIATWAIGIIFGLPLCIWRNYRERQWKNFLEIYCSENTKILPLYWHVLLCTLVWLPITIMTICYSTIFYKLDRYEKQILRRENPISVNFKTKAAKSLFIVLISFIICRIPFTVLVFWRNKMLKDAKINSVGNSFQILWFISHYMMYFNCAIDPILYGLTNENYRKAFGVSKFYQWISSPKNTKGDTTKRSAKTPEKINTFVRNLKIWPSGGKIKLKEENITSTEKKSDKVLTSDKITPIDIEYI